MATQNIERRVEKLESSLRIGDKPETIKEMIISMERGSYGPASMMSVTASILSNGGSGEHLRGSGLPDELIDFFVEAINKENPAQKEADKGGYERCQ